MKPTSSSAPLVRAGYDVVVVLAAALWMAVPHRFPPGISSSAVAKTAGGGMTAGQ